MLVAYCMRVQQMAHAVFETDVQLQGATTAHAVAAIFLLLIGYVLLTCVYKCKACIAQLFSRAVCASMGGSFVGSASLC
jgi:hypothetical protein